MLELFIVACTLVGECRNYREPMPDGISAHECMMGSMMSLSRWAEKHPGWRPTRWKCEKPSQDS